MSVSSGSGGSAGTSAGIRIVDAAWTMIAGDIVVSHQASATGFLRSEQRARCDDGVPLSAIAGRRRHTRVRLQRGRNPRALPRDRPRVRRLPAPRCTTRSKANSTLGIAKLLRDLGSGADANSIWEIEVAQAGRLSPRPTSCSPASASRPAELECAVPLGRRRSTSNRPASSIACEAIASQASASARASPSGSTRTSTRRAIRTSRRASRSTSSACRLDDGARS